MHSCMQGKRFRGPFQPRRLADLLRSLPPVPPHVFLPGNLGDLSAEVACQTTSKQFLIGSISCQGGVDLHTQCSSNARPPECTGSALHCHCHAVAAPIYASPRWLAVPTPPHGGRLRWIQTIITGTLPISVFIRRLRVTDPARFFSWLLPSGRLVSAAEE